MSDRVRSPANDALRSPRLSTPGIVWLRGPTVAAGLASQFTLGGSGGAWSSGLVESASFSSGGKVASVGLDIRHARPELVDSTVLFPESTATTAGTGFRDELSLGLHVDLCFDIESRLPKAEPFVAFYPRLSFLFGVMFTDTQLSLPAFAGPTNYRGRAISPLLGVGLGFEARAWEWVSLVPRIDLNATIGEDEHEIGGGARWDLEWRLSPGADFVVHF